METSSTERRRRRLVRLTDKDPPPPSLPSISLSDLPSEILDEILSHLPIRDAIRASLLSSSSFRRRWRSLPHLRVRIRLDSTSVSKSALDRILLLHSSPIRSFHLDAHNIISSDRLLRSLSHHSSLSSLHLHYVTTEKFPYYGHVSSSLFSFQSLKDLSLSAANVPPAPFQFTEFPLLQKLTLSSVNFSPCIISRCPVLRALHLEEVTLYSPLCISNPSLGSFSFSGWYAGISFTGGQTLEYVKIDTEELNYADVDLEKIFCDGATCNGTLELCQGTIIASAKCGVPECLPTCFQQLNVLHIEIDWADIEHIKIFVCMLRSAPSVRKLYVLGTKYWKVNELGLDAAFWKEQNIGELNSLQSVLIGHVSCFESQMEFLKFVLGRARMLKKVTISSFFRYSPLCDASIIEELKSYQKASTQSEFEIC